MLKKLKEHYSNTSFQFILIDPKGVVIDSDQTLLAVDKGTAIGELHPFFFSIPEIMASVQERTIFHCVQLGSQVDSLTADIEVLKKEGHILVVICDLTDHYLSYQAMAQSRNESIIDSELILLKNHELQEREEFKNEFIQNFSHELRNPLTNIIALTNILGRTDLNSEQQRILTVLKDSTANLKLMLEDILSISMIAKGKLALNPSVFSFSQLVDFLKLTYTTRAKEKGLVFKITTDEKIPAYLEGDRLRLLQVLTNLCDNATKYTAKGSILLHIDLHQKRANTVSLRFGVKDTGVGIPKESLETIFESFEQLGRTEGVGLGLAIVKGLLALMESKVNIDSTEGRGSHFYFDVKLNFPLHQPSTPVLQEHSKKKNTKSRTKKDSKFKVLLVEDNEQVQTALFKMLIDEGNFFIDVVNDGALVMEEVVSNTYDIILMDINLPNISGDQLVKVIRSFPFNNIKKIPVIGITAYSYEEQLKGYLKAGMNAVLAKPFEAHELLKIMHRFLR
ncbi:ATP-binding protein [uncultured Kriegella sp.]|uniref:ATP-binding response regulator n=1 Tax=uncultured Kriegella sp. TaxID=1798910 RepID=UPI0030DAC219|tara:strand:- start:150423 stop:151943 length:1521 start_codon:yes stop_codon:yes gene_type:complete